MNFSIGNIRSNPVSSRVWTGWESTRMLFFWKKNIKFLGYFGRFNPCFKTWVVTGKSRVHHGFVTGLVKPRVSLRPGVSLPKPRVSGPKAWVVTGKSRVEHGFCVPTLDFLFKKWKKQKKNPKQLLTYFGNPRSDGYPMGFQVFHSTLEAFSELPISKYLEDSALWSS